jgi:hypothetical protein
MSSSQRDSHFKGGIQKGTSATSSASTSTEKVLKSSVQKVKNSLPGVIWKPEIKGPQLEKFFGIEGANLSGIRPDGGVWVNQPDGQILCAAEAKKQGVKGNAIERWYKNFTVLNSLGAYVYLTICIGDGFFDNNSAQKIMEMALASERDERHRLRTDSIWNMPEGRVWLYRFRTPAAAAHSDLPSVIVQAIKKSKESHDRKNDTALHVGWWEE